MITFEPLIFLILSKHLILEHVTFDLLILHATRNSRRNMLEMPDANGKIKIAGQCYRRDASLHAIAARRRAEEFMQVTVGGSSPPPPSPSASTYAKKHGERVAH